MRFFSVGFAWLFPVLALVPGSAVYSMDVRLGSDGAQFVSAGDAWRFCRGQNPASEPPEAWKDPDFDDSQWQVGPSGFGYGDNDDATILGDMQGHYVTVYIRREFLVASPAPAGRLELTIDYDDGFIAYLNGREVARRGMPAGAATWQTLASVSHEAGTPETINLGTAGDWLRGGKNVLAIEGHNNTLTSSDLSLIPTLRAGSDVLMNGAMYIVTADTVRLEGQTRAAGAVSVLVLGVAADFYPADGTWHADVNLAPGLNTITAQALNAEANEVDSGSMEIVYVPPANHLTGELDEDVTLSGAYIADQSVTVPAGRVLTMEPGTVVLFQEGSRITIRGRLLAEGTPTEPIRFTRAGSGARWLGLQFDGTMEDNRICCALLEYARTDDGMIGVQQSRLLLEEVEFDHCDRRRIRTLNSSLTVRRCRFADMFGPTEPPTTDNMSENIWGSGIPDGGWLTIEECTFGRNKGHNDAIDFDGPARPKPIPYIHNNIFLGGGDDALDLECDALIEGNLFMDFVRDRYNKASGEANVLSAGAGKNYTMTHNIFVNAQHVAQVKDGAFLTFINNTAVNISREVIYFDLHLPGRKPGRGALVENSIFWNTPEVFEGMAGRDVLMVNYSLLPREWHGWGVGNIDTDPLFAQAGYWDPNGTPTDPNDDFWVAGDYHLQSQAGRWDPVVQQWVTDDVTSPSIDAGNESPEWKNEPWPNGQRINMGAYGGTAEASMSLSDVGSAADLNHDRRVDLWDYSVLAARWRGRGVLRPEDLDRDAMVDFADPGSLTWYWLWSANR
jgi:hypothetical protein